jgi:hypothetical protein
MKASSAAPTSSAAAIRNVNLHSSHKLCVKTTFSMITHGRSSSFQQSSVTMITQTEAFLRADKGGTAIFISLVMPAHGAAILHSYKMPAASSPETVRPNADVPIIPVPLSVHLVHAASLRKHPHTSLNCTRAIC